MQTAATALVTSLLLGGTYALIALGMVIVFRSTHTFNFAHGQFMLLAAYVLGRWGTSSHGAFFASSIVAVILVALVSAAFYYLILRRLLGASLFLALVATIALASFLDGVMAVIFDSPQYSVVNPLLPVGAVNIAGARVQQASVAIAVVSVALSIVIAVFLQRTPIGLRLRAAGQSPLLASQGGINVRRMYVFSWAAAGALAAVAGLTFASTNLVTNQISEVALFALPAMMLGGLDSVWGAVAGGLIIGVLQGVTTLYWGGEHVQLVTYLTLLLTLLFLPEGLFGTRVVQRV